jgi:membrane fusion protein (multidrug efflux system)
MQEETEMNAEPLIHEVTEIHGKPGRQAQTAGRKRRTRLHRNAGVVAGALAAFALCIAAYPVYSFFYISTNDAQIDGHIYPVASRVNGTVAWVNPEAENTRFVQAGTLLARLDADDYAPAVNKLEGQVQAERSQLTSAQMDLAIAKPNAESRLASAKAAVAEAEAELAAGIADAQSQEAHLAQARAAYKLAEADRQRYQALVETHEISKSEYDQRATEAATAREQVAMTAAELKASQTKIEALKQRLAGRKAELNAANVVPQTIDVAHARVDQMNGQLQESQAQLEESRLNLNHTAITAPVGGVIGQRQIEVGQRVETGQLLLDVVPTDNLWVTAYFKETQMRRMRVGQLATFKIDSYRRKLNGHIESIGGATGAKYSLLPPENSTGNFVKVVQRIPVRLHIDDAIDPKEPLLPGMSVEVSVNLR